MLVKQKKMNEQFVLVIIVLVLMKNNVIISNLYYWEIKIKFKETKVNVKEKANMVDDFKEIAKSKYSHVFIKDSWE